MRIIDYLSLIYKYLRTKKVRTFLTSLGITIGVATIFVLISLSQGLQNYIQNELNTIGNKIIYLYPGEKVGFENNINGLLSNNFIENIERLTGVELVIPALFTTTIFNYNNQQAGAYVLVVNTKYYNYLSYMDYKIYKGTLISNNYQCQVDLGYNIAMKSIPNEQINVGDYINIFGEKCEVIGIFQQTGSPLLDNTIIFPEGYYKKIFGNINYNYLIIIVNNFNLAYNSLENYINNLKGQHYIIVTAQSIEKTINQILGGLTLFSLIIASVSIVISAINILNTMYTSILERYKEIGLLKALGMKNYQVLLLFLLESGIIGLIGGIFGIITGFIFSYIVGFSFAYFGYSSISPYISIQLILLSLLFPFFIGMISGIIPAYKASKISPVEALKYE
ncbi:MAG: ABC transporter permease [Nanopusillaceae archaeon]|jgi:putative ABC transport system permease protein